MLVEYPIVATNMFSCKRFSFGMMALIFLSVGCDKNPDSVARTKANEQIATNGPPNQMLVTKESIEEAELSVLFVGNSHSGPIPRLLKEIFGQESPSKTVLFSRVASYGFLVDHAKRQSSIEFIQRGKWDFVVLQAQKYSTSGRFHYPYDGALKLSALAEAQGSKVMMYPEWSMRDKPDEYKRIDEIHHEIAEQTGATVAPIGLTWSKVSGSNPEIELYATDGNHASHAGSYLNAAIFYCMLTGKKIEAPESREDGSSADLPLNSEVKAVLNETAWSVVESHDLPNHHPQN